MGSTRLPGKVLMDVAGKTLLEYHFDRLQLAKRVDKVVVATTIEEKDDAIVSVCAQNDVDVFRGAEDDVLDRYYQCSLQYPEYGTVVRVTSDCPLIDPALIDAVIELYDHGNYDYACNSLAGFPSGVEAEVFTRAALEEAAQCAVMATEREHVIPYIKNNDHFRKGKLHADKDYSHFRYTVDEPEDAEVVSFLIQNSSVSDGFQTHVSLLEQHPEVAQKNAHIVRDASYLKQLENDFRVK